MSLGNCRFVGEHHNLLITGPTGIGKVLGWSGPVVAASPEVRAPRLLHELAVARGDGSYTRLLTKRQLDLLAIELAATR